MGSRTDQTSNRRYGGVDAESRVRDRRTKLVRAAIDLFGTDGYAGTSVQAVCDRAGLSKRYFYESFANPEELLLAAYDAATADAQGAVLAAMEGIADVYEAMVVGIGTYYEYLEQHRPEAAVMFSEILGVSDDVDAAYLRGTELVTAIVEPLVALADLEHSPPGLPRAITGLIVGAAHLWLMEGCVRPAAEPTEAVVTVLRALLGTGADPARGVSEG